MGSNKDILSYITGYVNRKRYGINTGDLNSDPLLYTYSEDTGCGYDLQCSQLTPCEDDIFYKVCNLTIEKIVEDKINYTKSKFTLSNIKNGLEPYTTEWVYDKAIYDLVESTATSLTLNRKLEEDFSTEVSARLVDKNGCIAYGAFFVEFEPIPFEPSLNCSGILVTGTFVTGTASNGKIKVPYTIKGYGTIAIAIDTNYDGFSGSKAAFDVVPGTGSVEFPLAFDGSGDYGIATVPVKLTYGNSSSSCNAEIEIEDVPAPPACTAPLNVTVEEDNDSDSDSDSDSSACVPVTLTSGGTLPHAINQTPYSHDIVFAGDLPLAITDLTMVGASWINAPTVIGNIVRITGTPTAVSTMNLSFKVGNGCGTPYQFSGQLITDNLVKNLHWVYSGGVAGVGGLGIEKNGVFAVGDTGAASSSGDLAVNYGDSIQVTLTASTDYNACLHIEDSSLAIIHDHCDPSGEVKTFTVGDKNISVTGIVSPL